MAHMDACASDDPLGDHYRHDAATGGDDGNVAAEGDVDGEGPGNEHGSDALHSQTLERLLDRLVRRIARRLTRDLFAER